MEGGGGGVAAVCDLVAVGMVAGRVSPVCGRPSGGRGPTNGISNTLDRTIAESIPVGGLLGIITHITYY